MQQQGLDFFAAGDPEAADFLLRKAYKNLADETGILVNLGLALMQQGWLIKLSEHTDSL